MDERKLNHKKIRLNIYFFAVVAVIIVITFPKGSTAFKYLYQVGRPWMYDDLVAPIDFPILKTESEMIREMEEKSITVVPCYRYEEDRWDGAYKSVREVLSERSYGADVLSRILPPLKNVYEAGIVEEGEIESDVIMIRRGNRVYDRPSASVFTVKKAAKYVTAAVMESDSLSSETKDFISEMNIERLIVPNIIFDEEQTQALHRSSHQDISPTKGMFYAGGMIVSKGEIITPEIAQLLDSYKTEDSLSVGDRSHVIGLGIGRVLTSFILLAAMLASVYFSDFRHTLKWRDLYYVMTLVMIMSLLSATARTTSVTLIYLIPYPLFALYLMSFYRQSLAFPVYSIMLLPVLLLVQNGIGVYFINLMGGLAVFVAFQHYNKGWHQFLSAFFVFLSMAVSFISFTLLWSGELTMDIVTPLWYMLLASLLIVFGYPLVFLFEKIFSLVSHRRLVELGDINNKLLREMSLKCPGSFQHSLQVANLAGEAARELDVNDALVRAGALYHDIGKLKNPLCFVENQPAGMNYHTGLTPEESAKQIISHVDDGVELARKHNLPNEVIDFILTHHAQSLAGYFYVTYVNGGGDPENKAPFTYHGKLPETVEQVIVMMADSVEAASRTLKDYSPESIRKLVSGIIDSRLEELQLIESDISFKELTRLKDIFTRHISQIYHDRITYPEKKPAL